MTNTLLSFYGFDPLVSWLLTFAVCLLIAAAVLVINHVFEQRQRRKEAEVRAMLNRIVAASEPRPWALPAKKGFQNDAHHKQRSA